MHSSDIVHDFELTIVLLSYLQLKRCLKVISVVVAVNVQEITVLNNTIENHKELLWKYEKIKKEHYIIKRAGVLK